MKRADVRVLDGITIKLPPHLIAFNEQYVGEKVVGKDAQMALALELVDAHIDVPGCGPFLSLIVDKEDDRILCIGANLVVHGNQSWAHGERIAFSLGQLTLGNFMFPKERFRLVTTAAMCIGCYGESLATGIAEIVAGARGSDVEEHTPFKEGVLPHDWKNHLLNQGINYFGDVLREECIAPLRKYGKEGIAYFNAGTGS